jgi:putative SOS response-associated peptidase YedK
MCGRFAQYTPVADLAEEYEIDKNLCDIRPRYNIAPGMEIAAIVIDQGKKIVKMKWGLIPSWSKDASIGYKMINARAETITEKPSFRSSFKKRRCLILADGFYEWKNDGREKVPVYVKHKNGEPFTLAGVYDFWKSPEGKVIGTCSIITTESNHIFSSIHNRMPVVIRKKDHRMWLDFAQDEQLILPFLKPFDENEFEFHEVSKDVNSLKNEHSRLILPTKTTTSET